LAFSTLALFLLPEAFILIHLVSLISLNFLFLAFPFSHFPFKLRLIL